MATAQSSSTLDTSASNRSSAAHSNAYPWTEKEETDLLHALRQCPAYCVALADFWFPHGQIQHPDVTNSFKIKIIQTPAYGITTLQRVTDIVAGEFAKRHQPWHVAQKLKDMRLRYEEEYQKMEVESRNKLLQEMTGHGDDEVRWRQQRVKLLSELHWWETFHETVHLYMLMMRHGTSDASISSASGADETGRVHTQSTSQQQRTSSSSANSAEEGRRDKGEQMQQLPHAVSNLAASSVASTSAIPSTNKMDLNSETLDNGDDDLNVRVTTGTASSHSTQQQPERTSATGTKTRTISSKAFVKMQKHLQTKRNIRTSRQLNKKTSSTERDSQKYKLLRTKLLIEREATKRLELKLKAKEQEQRMGLVSERMDALEVKMKVTNEEMQRALQQVDRRVQTLGAPSSSAAPTS
ncbi:unnamed protein product [Tilletia controversa]|uniref:Uncharacterized protein n=3 Tax=Tilletia TaxID=13289 RepID=A0A8X7MY85_9BASI|nr:hypothetical protein CF336_g1462 [Tilletia laevis]KAE8201358.1 hypothetical protein CF328_g2697 [Tilletia controversa]KAE8262719.1 hypothetical protein A4X03_0g2235 [Tilletia caries]KAE8207790.1 hypothetical protein CF335_g888 [Tilletia laevis]KAE8253362.1 hypothetical protein A4X06_0g1508 [Tilletia controversa]